VPSLAQVQHDQVADVGLVFSDQDVVGHGVRGRGGPAGLTAPAPGKRVFATAFASSLRGWP
jgi:hypothetical protein